MLCLRRILVILFWYLELLSDFLFWISRYIIYVLMIRIRNRVSFLGNEEEGSLVNYVYN